ncbi:MAG: hypothetical protein RX316_05770 [bacterium]|nr:hypothetical protein [bacterium]
MSKKKKKRVDEMTTEELIHYIFPKRVVKKIRKVVEAVDEKHRDKPLKK